MHRPSFKGMPAPEEVACDVLVVGGGVAGIAAAVAASRTGCATLLLEKRPVLGGTAIAGFHRFICGLYLTDTREAGTPLNGGISREVSQRLAAFADSANPVRLGRTFVLPCTTRHLAEVLNAILTGEPGLRVERETEIIAVEREADGIVTVTARGMAGLARITPRVVVDCSGDAAVVRLADGPFVLAPAARRQLAGFTVFLKGLKNVDATLRLKVPYCLNRAATEKSLPDWARFTTFIPGDTPGEGYCKFSLPPTRDPERDRHALATAEQMHECLRRALPAFRESHIADASPGVLERDGARLRGDYTLTEADVLAARKFPDAVVRAAWPIEYWDQQHGPRYTYLPPGESYEIPLCCLRTREIGNLLCAGRCLSATPRALASARVMGTCLALGEAAGHEAACQSGSIRRTVPGGAVKRKTRKGVFARRQDIAGVQRRNQ